MDIQFGNLSQLNLLWIVAIAVAAMILGAVARRAPPLVLPRPIFSGGCRQQEPWDGRP